MRGFLCVDKKQTNGHILDALAYLRNPSTKKPLRNFRKRLLFTLNLVGDTRIELVTPAV